MKKLILLFMTILSITLKAQVLVNIQSPEAGIFYRSQLWNMVLTNTSNTVVQVQVQLVMKDATTGREGLRAQSQTINLPVGTSQWNSTRFEPIQYTAGSSEILPVGEFLLCYNLFQLHGDNLVPLTQECQPLVVEPLSPLQLIAPVDKETINDLNPSFSWLPAAPSELFNNPSFDFTLVEKLPGQSSEQAMLNNIPLFQQENITSPTLLYTITQPSLQMGKTYVWQVLQRSSGKKIAQSQINEFSINHGDSAAEVKAPAFLQLVMDDVPSYAVQKGRVQFSYFNQANDSAWNIRLFDITQPKAVNLPLNLEEVAIRPGQNLVDLSAAALSFKNSHLYLLQVIDSRNQTWQALFEYKK